MLFCDEEDDIGVVELIGTKLLSLSSIQSTDVGEITLFTDSRPPILFKFLICPFMYPLVVGFRDFGGSVGGGNDSCGGRRGELFL